MNPNDPQSPGRPIGATPTSGIDADLIADAATPEFGATVDIVPIEEDRVTQLRGQASKLVDQATSKAREAATTGKDRATEALDDVVMSVRDTAQLLEEKAGPQVARYARQAADAIDDFATTLRERDVDQLVDDVRGFVRRSPGIAIGAAVAVGFVLSRFLKASASDYSDRAAGGYGVSSPGRSSPRRYDA